MAHHTAKGRIRALLGARAIKPHCTSRVPLRVPLSLRSLAAPRLVNAAAAIIVARYTLGKGVSVTACTPSRPAITAFHRQENQHDCSPAALRVRVVSIPTRQVGKSTRRDRGY